MRMSLCSSSSGAHRHYLAASGLLAVLCFPFIVVKMILFRYSGHDGAACAFIFALAGAFSWLHVLAARRVSENARRTYVFGLSGFATSPLSWDDMDTWVRRPTTQDMFKVGQPAKGVSSVWGGRHGARGYRSRPLGDMLRWVGLL